ncbi:hypothetical protein M4I33_10170 [Clostridium sp. LY3-2]|uniref:hypothetical protein n=1 Tax=Clostridium sp. LY3-2 TaxID=2942482 RepID=UPI002152E3D6|nr:hypothetical protein [Clostridium sp. LY3-2]MCR6515232.1 hypothetical protein [Clostridium sp. LY3-2]
MKKRLIGSLIAGIMILSLIGCGSEDKAKSDEGSKPVASEDINEAENEEIAKNNESLSPEEAKAEFARIKPELISYFKENGIKYKEKNDEWIAFEQKVGDMKLEGEISSNNDVYSKINIFFDGEKAGKGEVDIDLDKTMAPKVCDIVTGIKGKSYKDHYEEINQIVKNKHSENPDDSIEKEFGFSEERGKYKESVGMSINSSSGEMGINIKSK